jgi:hypothetical protein
MFAASKSGRTPVTAAPIVPDPNFKNVTLLLQTATTNGQQNNTFLDSSTNNATIVRNGTPTQGTFNPYWPNGQWSNYFNGSTDYLGCGTQSAYAFGTGAFTIEAWVYTGSNAAEKNIVSTRGSAGTVNGWSLSILTSNGIRFYPNSAVLSTTASIVLYTWNHIALVREGTGTNQLKLYVNGTNIASATSAENFTNQTLAIGNANDGTQFPFNGYISNLRLVKGTAVYTGNFTPPITPLQSIQSAGTNIAAITGTATSLLACQSNRFRDGSTNNFTITIGGTPRVQAFQPFPPSAAYTPAAYGGSVYFNGNPDYLATSAPNGSALDVSGGSNFTIETWFYATSTASTTIWVRGGTNGSQNGQYWAALNNGSLQWGFGNGGTGAAINTVTGVQYNCWNHFAVVLVGTTFTAYLNGTAINTATLTFTIPTTISNPTLWIGGQADPGARLWFSGYITGFRLVKGTAVYTGAFTPPTAPLSTAGSTSAASYPSTTNVNTSFAAAGTSILTNFANAGIYDASVQNNQITQSTVQASTAVSKWSPTSMRFNGTSDYLQTPFQPQFQLGTANFTIEFWIYFNSVAANQRVAGQDNNLSTLTWAIFTTVANRLDYYLSSVGTSWNMALGISMGSIAINTWYYVALVRNGSTFTPYINSVAGTVTTNAAALFASTAPLTLGAFASGPQTYFNGYIQDFRITRGIARTITTPTEAFPTR